MTAFQPRPTTVLEHKHEHPEDRADRLENELYGEKHAAEFVAEHADHVVRLIGHYADRDAEFLLSDLRELFWARVWTPKGTP